MLQSDLTLLEQVKLGKIWDFPGGVHPPERKHLSNSSAINTLPMPEALYIPLKQHIGSAGELIVSAGDNVKQGQPLTKPNGGLSLPVHAPTSGQVKAIIDHVSAHPSGFAEPTLVLIPDGLEQRVDPMPLENWQTQDKQQISQHLQTMAIAGLGGATFPTYVKTGTHKSIDLLIINAVECEPYITSDDVLMREHADEIVLGCQILAHATGANMTLIGIEDNKPEAIAAINAAIAELDNIESRVVPTKYPSGGEKQLIQLLTNQQVPAGGLPADLGITVQNVGTTFAVKRAIVDGLPLTHRVVTVTGESITQPQNLWVPFGAQVKDLLNFAGYTPDKDQRVIMGGPMMGFNIMDGAMPVVKATNCILAANDYYMPMRSTEQACIRCGDCAAACPAELLPQQMLWFSKAQDQEKLTEYNLFDCIECGACAYVCPSQIPLVQYYRTSKAEIRQAREDKAKSEKAKIRFEQRQARLEKEKEERLQRHKEAAERRKNAMAKDDSAKDKIAAALARAKAKKQGSPVDATEKPETTGAKDKVAEAIARAKAKKAAQAESSSSEAESSKDKVAAAIARAKAKKAAQAETPEDTVDSADNAELDKKAQVAAAIARAKAKKAAKAAEQAEPESESKEHTSSPEQDKKAQVAAAIARAKAKKAAKAAEQAEPEQAVGDSVEPSIGLSSEAEAISPEQEKKDKVAAAIARAKAKKAAKAAEKAEPEQAEGDIVEPSVELSSEAEAISPEQEKKDKVAAAIARAKAKKAAKAAEQAEPEQTEGDSVEPSDGLSSEAEAISPEQEKKDKVAAAIARAKAKKAAKDAEQADTESSEATTSSEAVSQETTAEVSESAPLTPEQEKKAKVAAAIARAKAKKAAKEAEQQGEAE